jgi:CarD family transcriptional regulator
VVLLAASVARSSAATTYRWMVMMFKPGDKAVYPGHGVGEVVGIEHTEVAGQRQSFYVLKMLERNGGRFLIPINKIGQVGLREIICEDDVRQVYAILKEKDIAVDQTTWNRRYREYMEKIKTGSVFEIAEVLRDLYLLKSDKDLSFGERKMLDTARSLLIKELAFAKGVTEQDIEDDLKKLFNIPDPAPKAADVPEKSERRGKESKEPKAAKEN